MLEGNDLFDILARLSSRWKQDKEEKEAGVIQIKNAPVVLRRIPRLEYIIKE
jgi:hypothetical protein